MLYCRYWTEWTLKLQKRNQYEELKSWTRCQSGNEVKMCSAKQMQFRTKDAKTPATSICNKIQHPENVSAFVYGHCRFETTGASEKIWRSFVKYWLYICVPQMQHCEVLKWSTRKNNWIYCLKKKLLGLVVIQYRFVTESYLKWL